MELLAVESDLKLLALELERPVKKVRFVPSSSESPSLPPPPRGAAWRCASRWRLGGWWDSRLRWPRVRAVETLPPPLTLGGRSGGSAPGPIFGNFATK